MKKWLSFILLLIVCAVALGCSNGRDENAGQNVIQVYYINREETAIVPVEYTLISEGTTDAVSEVLNLMKAEPEENELKPSISTSIDIYSCRINDGKLIIDFAKTYKDMQPTTEILVRAAIVRTVTQIEGITTVEFEIEGESMIDYAGIVVGSMNKEQFIDNTGTEISAYQEANLQLYFANADGTALVPVTRRVEYNTNISLEKLVMEQLIKGPEVTEGNPTINPATKVINVTVNDGTCYVNLDQTFLTQVYAVNSEVTIYSIVNSLVELEDVNKVQILINGQSEISYRESINLNTTFGRNLDLVEEEAPQDEE
ncbi:MAG: GerMN domain-containing protein [Lachnospiraceae bacterium]|nr:GerMN domain-containing protein [Lachnospiraceae bacterium]